MIGKHSGLAAITALLAELQLSVNAEEARSVLARVRQHAVAHKGAVARETVTAIWREVRERSLPNCA